MYEKSRMVSMITFSQANRKGDLYQSWVILEYKFWAPYGRNEGTETNDCSSNMVVICASICWIYDGFTAGAWLAMSVGAIRRRAIFRTLRNNAKPSTSKTTGGHTPDMMASKKMSKYW